MEDELEASETLKKNLERYRHFLQEARKSVDFWVDGPITEFAEDIWRLMEEQKVSRAELARRLGTSRAYVTKLLGGRSGDITLLRAPVSQAALHREVLRPGRGHHLLPQRRRQHLHGCEEHLCELPAGLPGGAKPVRQHHRELYVLDA